MRSQTQHSRASVCHACMGSRLTAISRHPHTLAMLNTRHYPIIMSRLAKGAVLGGISFLYDCKAIWRAVYGGVAVFWLAEVHTSGIILSRSPSWARRALSMTQSEGGASF